MTFNRYMVLLFICLSGSVGDFCLKRGMDKLPPIGMDNLIMVLSALKQPQIVVGIFLLIGFFAAYLNALSWADLTYVLPSTSVGYIVVALLSKFVLHEQITVYRWTGIVLIVTGVGFVTQGPAKTTSHPSTMEGEA
jgi:drug/metabolite transporter (DMT)-like permease